jgi:hypothetical protein
MTEPFDLSAKQINDRSLSISLNAYSDRSPTKFKDAADNTMVLHNMLWDGMTFSKFDAEISPDAQHRLLKVLEDRTKALMKLHNQARK